jgi:hypothetical protein
MKKKETRQNRNGCCATRARQGRKRKVKENKKRITKKQTKNIIVAARHNSMRIRIGANNYYGRWRGRAPPNFSPAGTVKHVQLAIWHML